MSAEEISDEVLASLSAEGRRVIRGMARGGWASGSPAAPAVRRTVEHLGDGFHFWNSEQIAGEPRAFYPEGGRRAEKFWETLAERLDALPRRKPQPKPKPEPPIEVFAEPEREQSLAEQICAHVHPTVLAQQIFGSCDTCKRYTLAFLESDWLAKDREAHR